MDFFTEHVTIWRASQNVHTDPKMEKKDLSKQQVRPAAVWEVRGWCHPSLPHMGLPSNHAMGDSRQGHTSTPPSAALEQGLEWDQGS